jgi:hypothetical protein
MSDEQNPPLPDWGPGDGTHEGDDWEVGEHGNPSETDPDAGGSDDAARRGHADTGLDGALSPGSTATGSPTERE